MIPRILIFGIKQITDKTHQPIVLKSVETHLTSLSQVAVIVRVVSLLLKAIGQHHVLPLVMVMQVKLVVEVMQTKFFIILLILLRFLQPILILVVLTIFIPQEILMVLPFLEWGIVSKTVQQFVLVILILGYKVHHNVGVVVVIIIMVLLRRVIMDVQLIIMRFVGVTCRIRFT